MRVFSSSTDFRKFHKLKLVTVGGRIRSKYKVQSEVQSSHFELFYEVRVFCFPCDFTKFKVHFEVYSEIFEIQIFLRFSKIF